MKTTPENLARVIEQNRHELPALDYNDPQTREGIDMVLKSLEAEKVRSAQR